MKIKTLLAMATLAVLAIGADAQTPTKAPVKPPVKQTGTTKKTTPMRDPKTGRFVKKTSASSTKVHAKTTKPGPARDPKTGRFIKKKG